MVSRLRYNLHFKRLIIQLVFAHLETYEVKLISTYFNANINCLNVIPEKFQFRSMTCQVRKKNETDNGLSNYWINRTAISVGKCRYFVLEYNSYVKFSANLNCVKLLEEIIEIKSKTNWYLKRKAWTKLLINFQSEICEPR